MEKNQISHFVDTLDAKTFGIMTDGTAVLCHTISNLRGMEASVITYGATITSLQIPARGGKVDVVLGFDSLQNYIDSYSLPSAPYFGAVIGRYSGRIKKRKFSINGQKYQAASNHGEHTLHGGFEGFGQKVWQVENVSANAITLSYTSADGEEGFPGELTVHVSYTLTEDNKLVVQYWAASTKDTVLNLTQHSYFNLEGHSQTIEKQQLFINSNKVLETRPDGIPTGLLLKVDNCPYDLTTPKDCPTKIDTTFIIDDNTVPVASLTSEETGLKMTVRTNQPSVHVYVGGNCFGKIKGKEDTQYNTLSGICFEAQHYPDAPNHPHFPSTLLKKGEEYHQKTSFKFEQL